MHLNRIETRTNCTLKTSPIYLLNAPIVEKEIPRFHMYPGAPTSILCPKTIYLGVTAGARAASHVSSDVSIAR